MRIAYDKGMPGKKSMLLLAETVKSSLEEHKDGALQLP